MRSLKINEKTKNQDNKKNIQRVPKSGDKDLPLMMTLHGNFRVSHAMPCDVYEHREEGYIPRTSLIYHKDIFY